MTQDMQEMWDEAEKEVEASLADSPIEDSDSASDDVASEESSEASAPPESGRDRLDFTDPDAIAEYLSAHPEDAKDVIRDFKRNMDGRRGTEISQMQALQQSLIDMQAKVNQLSQPTTDSSEPDEYGLTPAQYKELRQILLKALPESQQANQAVQQMSMQQQTDAVWNGVRKEYGEAFTPKRQQRVERLLRKSGYNWNDPDVIAECEDVKVEMESEKRSNRTKKVEEEQATRSNTQRRVAASTIRPLVTSAPATDDISVTDDKGNVTIEAMMKAANTLSRRIDRSMR